MADDADSDDDDLTFNTTYRPTEASMLLPAKEADFRSFLCDSGAAEEVIRLLVGLAESSNPPKDPVAFLRAKFDAQTLPEMVSGKQREDIPGLLAENAALQERTSALAAQVDGAVAELEAREAARHGALLDGLLSSGSYSSDATEGALDLAKLYAAVAARFPPPPEEPEEGAAPFAWAAEDAAAPAGTLTAESLADWAKESFGYGAALAARHPGLSLALVCAAANGEEGVEIDEAAATGLFNACVALMPHTEEAKAPPAEEEAA